MTVADQTLTEKIAEVLEGDRHVEHGRDASGPWGEWITLDRLAAAHLAAMATAVVAEWLEDLETLHRLPVGGTFAFAVARALAAEALRETP